MIYFRTTTASNVRSEPRQTLPHEPTNVVATLPANHWFVGVEVSGDWVEGFSTFEGETINGYVHRNLLRIEDIVSTPPQMPQKESPIKRHEVFFEEQAEKLRPFLSINPPNEDARAAEALSFNRSRFVDIDWQYVFSPKLVEDYTGRELDTIFNLQESLRYFQSYFDDLWGVDSENFDDLKEVFLEAKTIKIPRLSQAATGETAITLDTKADAWVLKHPLAKRWYFVQTKEGDDPLGESDFADFAAYKNIWAVRAQSVEVCFDDTETDDTSHLLLSNSEEIDLAPSIIVRQYKEINDLRAFASTLSTKADELATSQVTSLLTENQINQLLNAILRMKQPLRDVEFNERRLVDKASDLNYILPLQPREYTYPDGSKLQLEAGNLYKPYRTVVSWQVQVKRTKYVVTKTKFLGVTVGKSRRRIEWMEPVTKYRQVTKYGKVNVDLDPWEEKEVELSQNEGLTSYRFERINGDYFDLNGRSLRDVIERCDRDEDFRRATAIWLPVYEQKLTEGEILTKYTIVKRPFLGYTPVRSPALFVHEALSYRTAWRSSELGELVHSINMGPGEERTITVEQSTSREVETVQSTTSILDLTRNDSLELSTEIEKEASKSSESTRTNTLSASAGGSIGAFSGSASGSTSSTKTAKQFARQMERVARKAARNITRRSHQEVKSTTTVTTRASRSESTSINVKNVNEGRTLNLLFYRLYNIFDARLTAESLQFVSEDGVELVSGSGITIPRVFDFIEFDQALEFFDLGKLPFETSYEPGTDEYTDIFVSYWSYIIDQVLALLKNEYSIGGGTESAQMITLGAALAEIANAPKEPHIDPGEGEDKNSLENLYRALRDALEEIISDLEKSIDSGSNDDKPLLPLLTHDLRVASPGLYVDTVMGVSPATEPYAEEMRAQKVLLEAAEVAKQSAIANYYKSLSGESSGADQGAGQSFDVVSANAISDRELSFPAGALSQGVSYELEVNAKVLAEFEVSEGETKLLDWAEPQDWLAEPDDNIVVLLGGPKPILVGILGPGGKHA